MCACTYVVLHTAINILHSLPLIKLANKLLLELPLFKRIPFHSSFYSFLFVSLFVSLGETLSNLLQSAHHHSSSPSLLVQRSVARHTTLGKTLVQGGGGFCDIYEGRWRNDRVLVKIYPSKYEKMWFTETEIYQVGWTGGFVMSCHVMSVVGMVFTCIDCEEGKREKKFCGEGREQCIISCARQSRYWEGFE